MNRLLSQKELSVEVINSKILNKDRIKFMKENYIKEEIDAIHKALEEERRF